MVDPKCEGNPEICKHCCNGFCEFYNMTLEDAFVICDGIPEDYE